MPSIALRRKSTSGKSSSVAIWAVTTAALVVAFYSFTNDLGGEDCSPLVSDPQLLLRAKDAVAATVPKKAQAAFPWPGVPEEKLGSKLVQIGSNFVSDSRRLLIDEHLQEFLEAYDNRPDKTNLCGIRINHAYALFVAIKHLQPTAIIESGVNAGMSTYMMRAAAPSAKLYPIDPLDTPICNQKTRWIDTVNAEYYTGKEKFKDIGEIDWEGKIQSGEIDPARTLVFLDDHLEVFFRLKYLHKFGFRHVVLEDNYKLGEGATLKDKAGWTPKQMFRKPDDINSQWLFRNLISYAEFPPLVPPIMAKDFEIKRKKAGGFMHAKDGNTDIVAPLLRPDLSESDRKIYEQICKHLNVDPNIRDNESYMQLMNYNQFAYFELQPMAPQFAQSMS